MKEIRKIAVFLADGFEEIEATTIVDVLRRASFEVSTISINQQLQVSGSHHISILADQLLDNAKFEVFDMLVLPGGMPGAKNLDENEELKMHLLSFYIQGKWVAAICAAPLVLGKLGILKGKKAVCYPGYENFLDGAEILTDPVVLDENVITGNGVGGALAFALKIVEVLDSKEKAERLASSMLVEVHAQ